ncbi:MAG: hypothetical protein ACRC6E_11590 [Fusobacteriaceae bacterium]
MGFSLRRTIRRIGRSISRGARDVGRVAMGVVTMGGSYQAEIAKKQEALAREQMDMEKKSAEEAEKDRVDKEQEVRDGQLGAFENQGSALGSLDISAEQVLGGKKKKLSAL